MQDQRRTHRNNQSPLVSIIVTSYNVKKFIGRCLESVIGQTYKNLEIIVVDDKSTDDSRDIIENFIKEDDRIKLSVKSNNEGSNKARETGFNNSRGEYVAFVDGDDVIAKDYVEILLRPLQDLKVDIAIAGFLTFNDDKDLENIICKNHKNHVKKIVAREDILRYYLLRTNFGYDSIYPNVVWGRIFRRCVIAKTDWWMSNYRANEDEFENLQWFNFARSIALIDDTLYFYRQNHTSTTLSVYKNVDPFGNSVNRFELRRVLYEQILVYLPLDNIEQAASARLRDETNYLAKKYQSVLTPSDKHEIQINHRITAAHTSPTVVSVIIPVYNVAKYIEACLKSVIKQTYRRLEIIVIDDCSSDASGAIVDHLAEKDERIRVIHEEKNRGTFAARVSGLTLMSGDYFLFVDGDDTIEKDYIADLMGEAIKSGADLIFARGFVMSHEDDQKNYPEEFPVDGYRNIGKDYGKFVEEITFNVRGWEPWGKLYRSEIYTQASPSLREIDAHLTMLEDFLFFIIISFFCQKTSVCSTYGYNYLQRVGAATKAMDKKIFEKYTGDINYIFSKARTFLHKNGVLNKDDVLSRFHIGIQSGCEWNLRRSISTRIQLSGKKRILCPTNYGNMNGGGERSSYVLWRWLNQFYDVILLLPKDTDRKYIAQCETDGMSYVIGDYDRQLGDNTKIAWRYFSKIINDYKIDIVFPNMYFAPAIFAAAMSNVPVVFLDYDLLHQLTYDLADNIQFRKSYIDRMRMSNLIITNSMAGVDAAKKFVNRNAVCAYSFTQKPSVNIAAGREIRLIYPARIEPGQKNQLQLIQFAAVLSTRGYRNEIILMGSYDKHHPDLKRYYYKISRYITRHNLNNQIKLLGWVDNPWAKFTDKDIYVSTTNFEAVGRATLEAVELGIPILIPDIAGHREFREIIGITEVHFYKPGSQEDFIAKATYMINHIAEMRLEAQKFAKIALEKFSEERCNENILPAINNLLGQDNYGREIAFDRILSGELDYDRERANAEQLRQGMAGYMARVNGRDYIRARLGVDKPGLVPRVKVL